MTEERIKEIVSELLSNQTPNDYFLNGGAKAVCDFAGLCCKRVLEEDKEERIAQKRRQNGYRITDSCKFCEHCTRTDDALICNLDGTETMDIAICNNFELEKVPKQQL